MNLNNWHFLFAIILAAFLSPLAQLATGAELKQVNFFIDARERRVALPTDPKAAVTCQPLLDNGEDFAVDTVHPEYLIIKAVGQRPATGLLIVSCASETTYANLEFKPKHEFARGAPQTPPTFIRPLSYLDLETRYDYSEEVLGVNYGLTDQSSDLVKISLARQIPEVNSHAQNTSTFDVEKPIGNHTVSASLSEARYVRVARTQAVSHQYNGYALLLSQTRTEGEGFSKKLNLALPDPWSYQYSFSTSPFGERRHQMQRPTYYANAHFLNRFNPVYRYEILDDIYERQELALNNSTLVFSTPVFIPELKVGGLCGETCRMNLLGISTSAFWKNTSLLGSFDPVPGTVEAKGLMEFAGNLSAGIEYRRATGNRYLADTERVIVLESGPAAISANGRFEKVMGPGHAFAEVRQNFVPIIAEGTSFATGYTARTRMLDYAFKAEVFQVAVTPKPVLLATVRYFFDQNIRRFEYMSKPHVITGQVLERYTGKPVAAAEVSLSNSTGEQTVVVTDSNGLFRFDNTVKSGDLRIEVRKDSFVQDVTFTKKLETSETSHDIVLDVYSVISVKFFEDSDSNGSYNVGDIQVNLKNFDPLFNLGIVGAEDGFYISEMLIVPKKTRTEFQVKEELLPAEYVVVSLGAEAVDTSKSESVLTVLLRKK